MMYPFIPNIPISMSEYLSLLPQVTVDHQPKTLYRFRSKKLFGLKKGNVLLDQGFLIEFFCEDEEMLLKVQAHLKKDGFGKSIARGEMEMGEEDDEKILDATSGKISYKSGSYSFLLTSYHLSMNFHDFIEKEGDYFAKTAKKYQKRLSILLSEAASGGYIYFPDGHEEHRFDVFVCLEPTKFAYGSVRVLYRFAKDDLELKDLNARLLISEEVYHRYAGR